MSVKTKRVLLALFLSVFLIFPTAILANTYSSILAFGDSLSDNGVFGQYADAVNINPLDTYNPLYNNGIMRFSNGPVWVEYLAGPSHLNVPLLDLAIGGATTAWDNPALYQATNIPLFLTTRGLQWEVWAYGQRFGNSNSISPTTLVTLWAGGNDMLNLRPPNTAADNIESAIQNLINFGGHSFLIPNLPINISDIPPVIAWKQAFDNELALDLAALKALYPEIDIDALDMNGLVLIGIDHYDGTWLAHDKGPGTYAWWDTVGIHPTTEVHTQIADYAAAAVPEPATLLLLGSGLIGLAGYGRKKFFKK